MFGFNDLALASIKKALAGLPLSHELRISEAMSSSNEEKYFIVRKIQCPVLKSKNAVQKIMDQYDLISELNIRVGFQLLLNYSQNLFSERVV